MHAVRKSAITITAFALFMVVSLYYFDCAFHLILFLVFLIFILVLCNSTLSALAYHKVCDCYKNSGGADDSNN